MLQRLQSELAQDTFEYVLVVGVVVVAFVAGLLAFDSVVEAFVGLVCPSIDTAKDIVSSTGSCLK